MKESVVGGSVSDRTGFITGSTDTLGIQNDLVFRACEKFRMKSGVPPAPDVGVDLHRRFKNPHVGNARLDRRV